MLFSNVIVGYEFLEYLITKIKLKEYVGKYKIAYILPTFYKNNVILK